MALDYRGDYIVRFGFPHRINGDGTLADVDLLTAANSATCSFAAYSVPIRSTVVEVLTTTTINVELADIAKFVNVQRIEFIDGLSAAQIVTIDSVTPLAGTLGFSADAIASPPKVGSPCRLIFGPNGNERQVMTEYGTAVPPVDAATRLWGWEGGFTNSLYPEVTPAMQFEIESRVIGSGGNLDGVKREFHVMRDTRNA
jgi:hypothetical protein